MIDIHKGHEMPRFFTLEYWMDEGWYVGRIKEVPGVFSQGKTLEELKKNVLEAYHLMIDEDAKELPPISRDRIKEIPLEI
ncbi:type II toxin-antitoxin system HicB family antitoxin [Acidobacteriota bacterium]